MPTTHWQAPLASYFASTPAIVLPGVNVAQPKLAVPLALPTQ
jgi:hypothetical protein